MTEEEFARIVRDDGHLTPRQSKALIAYVRELREEKVHQEALTVAYADDRNDWQQRAEQAEAECAILGQVIGFFWCRYRWKTAEPREDLAETQAEADAIYKAGQVKSTECFDILTQALANTDTRKQAAEVLRAAEDWFKTWDWEPDCHDYDPQDISLYHAVKDYRSQREGGQADAREYRAG